MTKQRSLQDPISKIKGVGATRVKSLHKLGIYTVEDLLTYFPFRFNDFKVQDLSTVQDNQKIAVKGTIMQLRFQSYGYRRNCITAVTSVPSNGYNYRLYVKFWNQPWLKRKLAVGKTIEVYGVFQGKYKSLNVNKILDSKKAHQLTPVYSTTQGVYKATIRRSIQQAYKQYHDLIYTYLPSKIKSHYRLEDEPTVIHDLHFPKTMKAEQLARRTAKFNDFFLYQMRLQVLKSKNNKSRGAQIKGKKTVIKKFKNSLPFKLTPAQSKCTKQIMSDMASDKEMNRLLQGDVGSGKTIVAAVAILDAITAGYQTAIMVPTSVLAKQHAKSFTKVFKGMGFHIALLIGDLKPKQQAKMQNKIKSGYYDLIIGTDALISDNVQYHKLGLAVIDEQHRFGVDQRQALRKKGKGTNMLAMTATPIPRTLEITAYGDMDVSVINQLPKGRKPVKTYWIKMDNVRNVIPGIERLMNKHQQVYVVAPLVKQSKNTPDDMYDAESIYNAFKYYLPSKYHIALLHGQMDDDKKDKIMADFKAGKYNMLVATTVIEVGVDVSDASLMMIFNADHFGLAQLHQLRGRVGRGSMQAYCILVADPKNQDGVKRMRVMESTTNGFKISKYDLLLRGGGNLFGEEQSGMPKFKVGDPIGDRVILSCAQQVAEKVVNTPNWNNKPENKKLVYKLKSDSTTNMLD